MYDWKSITSPTPPDEIEQLEKYCQEVADPHGVAIEVGSYEGATAALMANYFNHIVCIDPWGDHAANEGERIAEFSGNLGRNRHFPVFMSNIERLGLIGKVTPIVSTSVCLNVLIPVRTISFFFVDGAHVYDAVKQDLDMAWLITKDSGLVVVHDYMRQPYDEGGDSYIGVKKAVDEAVANGKFSVHHYYSGIVALKVQ